MLKITKCLHEDPHPSSGRKSEWATQLDYRLSQRYNSQIVSHTCFCPFQRHVLFKFLWYDIWNYSAVLLKLYVLTIDFHIRKIRYSAHGLYIDSSWKLKASTMWNVKDKDFEIEWFCLPHLFYKLFHTTLLSSTGVFFRRIFIVKICP